MLNFNKSAVVQQTALQKAQQKWTAGLKDSFKDSLSSVNSSSENQNIKDLKAIQKKHFSAFLKKSFPSSKEAYWKFTKSNKYMRLSPARPAAVKTPNHETSPPLCSEFTNNIKKAVSPSVVVHNGSITPETQSRKNLPAGVELYEWGKWPKEFTVYEQLKNLFRREGDGFCHLAGAFMNGGIILYVPDHVKVKKPVHIHFSFDDAFLEKTSSNKTHFKSTFWNIRNFVFAGRSSCLTLVESFSAGKNTLVNITSDLQCADKSQVNWLKADDSQADSVLINQSLCNIQNQACLNLLNLSVGAGFSRDAVEVHQTGESAQSLLLHLHLLKQKAEKDQRFIVKHLKPKGSSLQFSRGILTHFSKSLFHGKTYIDAKATASSASQAVKNLSLSRQAESYTYPELDIHCSDVKARHGASAGDLSADELFYLKSRGLDESTARRMLITGYLKDILNRFPEPLIIQKLNLTNKIPDDFCVPS